MEILSKGILVLTVVLILVSFDRPLSIETYTLTVEVQGLRNSKGAVQFALYNKEGSFPDQEFKKHYKIRSSAISDGRSSTTFINLPKGRYAINILHDENNNGKIDKKFMLPLPKEGVGFSNYYDFGLSNRPNFKDASFSLHTNKTIKVQVIYK